MTDPVDLTARLVRCASVTPEEGGALRLLEEVLSAAGFTTTRVDREGIPNLLAEWGAGRNGKRLGFNGHTDVVPIGNRADWSVDPFGAEIIDGYLYGRGATDMKSGVAAFVAAAIDFVQETPPDGGLIITITGDEEGDAQHGTRALLDHMAAQGLAMDACIVGEPTSTAATGDVVKIGRRGSMTAYITASGVQGHAAYPQKALNPLHGLTMMLADLTATPLDDGSEHFDPSTLQITTIDTGNPANNVIPGSARATVNIRFSDRHSSDTVKAHIEAAAERATAATGTRFAIRWHVSGESFLTPPGPLSDLVAGAIRAETGLTPELSTSGGTSDARFVKTHCPVIEVGLVGERMHAVDERVRIDHIHKLKAIHRRILTDYFGT